MKPDASNLMGSLSRSQPRRDRQRAVRRTAACPSFATACLSFATAWLLLHVAARADQPAGHIGPALKPQASQGERDQQTPTLRPPPIWLVSAREAICNGQTAAPQPSLRYFRYDARTPRGCGVWQTSDPVEFLGSLDPSLPVVLFVHGNRVSRGEDEQRSLAVFRALAEFRCDGREVQFVAYSWPADQVRGPLRDARLKAHRTGPAGYMLARLVDQMDPQTPVAMVGYSYGARVITGALHVLGGGHLEDYPLTQPTHAQRPRIRTVLLTAAVHDDWLLPGHYHGKALSAVDRMLVFTNPCDPVLRWYHKVDPCADARALGRCGLASTGRLAEERHKVEQVDVQHLIGRSHDLMRYLHAPELMRQTWSYVSFDDMGQFCP